MDFGDNTKIFCDDFLKDNALYFSIKFKNA